MPKRFLLLRQQKHFPGHQTEALRLLAARGGKRQRGSALLWKPTKAGSTSPLKVQIKPLGRRAEALPFSQRMNKGPGLKRFVEKCPSEKKRFLGNPRPGPLLPQTTKVKRFASLPFLGLKCFGFSGRRERSASFFNRGQHSNRTFCTGCLTLGSDKSPGPVLVGRERSASPLGFKTLPRPEALRFNRRRCRVGNLSPARN